MKKFYRLSWKLDTEPLHLLWSAVLALYVMLYINFFIGSMGGFPSCLGFFVVFYLLKALSNSGNSISHQLAMTSKTETLYIFANYAVGYFLVWAVTKVLQVLARITGWGTIEGMSLRNYLSNLYGSTMLERWAYFFTGILMFAFVMSLFPVIVLRKKKMIVFYVAMDSVFFGLVCGVVRLICRVFIRDDLEKRASCILDDMLLCEIPQKWEAVMYLVAVILFTVAIMIVAIRIAMYYHGPKPGKVKVEESRFPIEEDEEAFIQACEAMEKKKRKRMLVSGSIAVVLLIAILVFLFMPEKNKPGYNKVAEFLTNDAVLGPMVYGNDVYIPVNMKLNYHEDGFSLGYIGHKGENCDSRFYKLAVSNLLYRQSGSTFLEMYGAERNYFQSAKTVEKEKGWMSDSVFFLWDEDWTSEMAYSKDVTGYTYIDKEFLLQLEDEYGHVELRASDFTDYDAYFTIRGYKDIAAPLENQEMCGDWVGCILVKDNKFYYGNYDNPIEGVYLQKLRSVIGGNTNGGNPTTPPETTEEETRNEE